MMRLAFLSCILIAFCAPAQAQLVRGYGVKAGPTFSNVRSPDLDLGGEAPLVFDTERRTGVALFAFVEWLDGPFFSVVTEAGYVQRGFEQIQEARTGPGEDGMLREVTLDTRFDYASFGAYARLRRPHGALTPYVLGGPRLDVFLGGEPDGEGSLADSYAPVAFGGTFGSGVEVARLLPVAVYAEVRYGVDLTNSLPDVPRDAYNNAFDVVLGLRL